MGRLTISGAIAGGSPGIAPSQLPFIDTFAGPDSNPIGSPYSSVALMGGGNIQRSGGMAFGTGAGRNQVSVSIPAGTHHYAQLQVGSLGAVLGGIMAGPIVGISATIAYVFSIADDGNVYLSRCTAGPTFVDVTPPQAHAHVSGQTYYLEAEQVGADVVLTPRIDGVAIAGAPFTDAGRTMGVSCGILLRNTDCQGLRFEMDEL